MVAFTNKYGIKRVQISAYNLKANGIVEHGYRSILEALSKIGGGRRHQRKNLTTMLLVKRTLIYRPTSITLFFLIYKREAILPINTRYTTQRLLN